MPDGVFPVALGGGPDGERRIGGSGGGRVTVRGVARGTTADGGTGYSFKIGGTTSDDLDFWTTPEGATPGQFNLRVVEAIGHTVSLPYGTMGPFLFSGQGLKLQHGSVTHYKLVQEGVSDTRVMTIK